MTQKPRTNDPRPGGEIPIEIELAGEEPGSPAADAAPAEAPATDVAPDAGDPAAALAAMNDRHLRLMAEFDNFRRRSFREREAARQAGIETLAAPLLEVLDNLERALAHAGDAPPGPWIDGVALTARQLAEALRGVGVEPVDPLGRPFDPACHDALAMAPSAEVPADHVVQVVSRGYRLGDRVLRPARVIVSRGPDGGDGS
jgi:molecular chaperone GrpE